MTLDEMMAKLDAKLEADMEELAREAKKREIEYNEQVNRLHEIQPRIQAIIDAYNYAIDIGIVKHIKEKKVNLNWSFMAEGFYHCVGIMRDPRFMGIYAGGACGPWDFYVNGNEFFARHEKEGTYGEAKLYDIKKFCDNFETYERAFFNLIESL